MLSRSTQEWPTKKNQPNALACAVALVIVWLINSNLIYNVRLKKPKSTTTVHQI